MADGGSALLQRLSADSREALRAREAGRLRLGVLRLVIAAVRAAEIDQRRDLTDEEVLAVIGREVRQRQDALAEIAGHGREDAEARLKAEIEVLRAYLPQPLSPEELDAAVEAALAETGASSAREMGRVMAVLMPRVRGRAEGADVQARVRARLNA